MTKQMEIEVVQINDYLTYFYWGRHENDPMMDMRLGGGSFAIHKNGKALVIDTMARPGQGAWVREYLERIYQISHFTLVSSHWHVDHIIDNYVYADSMIIAHKKTREIMLEKKHQFETGQYGDYGPFQVELPNLVFEDSLEFWLDDMNVVLREYKVHEEGHLGIFLPDEKIFIANDILEDPIWFLDFEFAPPDVQLMELKKLMSEEIDAIFPCHGSIDVVKNGGYSKELIQANIHYLEAMLSNMNKSEFLNMAVEDLLPDELAGGIINWWEPYREVHELNQAHLLKTMKQD